MFKKSIEKRIVGESMSCAGIISYSPINYSQSLRNELLIDFMDLWLSEKLISKKEYKAMKKSPGIYHFICCDTNKDDSYAKDASNQQKDSIWTPGCLFDLYNDSYQKEK